MASQGQASVTPAKRKLDNSISQSQSATSSSKKAKSSSGGYTKSIKFWYSYGDVILIVEHMLYKLHGPTLAPQSEYIRLLLDGESVKGLSMLETDGLPSYVVRGTNIRDFEVLLDVLDSAVLVTYFLARPPFDAVASILRVSTVLRFPQFRAFAITCLAQAWPSDPKARTVLCKWKKFAADTVTLARAYDVPSILKRPLYELLITPGFKITPTDTISSDDMYLLATAREQLSSIWHTTIVEELSTEPSLCNVHKSSRRGHSTYECRETFDIRYMKNGITTTNAYMADPISGLDAILQSLETNNDDEGVKWCSKCISEKKAFLCSLKMEIWTKLDQWLGLKG